MAAAATSLSGHWPLAGFARLGEDTPAGAPAGGEVSWSVRGRQRAVPGGGAEIWLDLVARAPVCRECQRCLQPVTIDVEVARPLRFVAGEALAAALDAESEDDVLELSTSLDLHALVEEELLLALPLVPMHEHCLPPLQDAAAGASAPDAAAHPFAALARLKRDGRGA